MRAATEGSLPPVMPGGNLVEVLGREVRQESPGELMVESSPCRQRRPPCKTNKEMSDEAADTAALTYLLTYFERPTQDETQAKMARVPASQIFRLFGGDWAKRCMPVRPLRCITEAKDQVLPSSSFTWGNRLSTT